jgi:hypothetical protein
VEMADKETVCDVVTFIKLIRNCDYQAMGVITKEMQ